MQELLILNKTWCNFRPHIIRSKDATQRNQIAEIAKKKLEIDNTFAFYATIRMCF